MAIEALIEVPVALKLYNTLTRDKAEFKPIDPGNVRMYVCGPTVYDFAHIGNARPVIVFDVLFRLLRHIYGPEHVTYVRNITDVDDKINARAAERYGDLAPEVGIRKLTEETAAQFHKDIAALGVLPPTVEPRATEHITEMVDLCDRLIKNGHAYVAADHVLFDVSSMKDYGRLSNRSLEEMEAGARVEVAPYKKGPMDFVLWKPSKPGEPGWPSPGGIAVKGRPGWHIECSAMADRWLWQEVKDRLSAEARARPHQFDIHGGGIDLTFPHHENEIAQSRCAHETPVMANVWMHNGFLQVEGEKMSKSLGNFITIRQLLDEGWPGEVLRFNMLRTHYRQPIDWTKKSLEESARILEGWLPVFDIRPPGTPAPSVVEALSDDLNTPMAIAELHKLDNSGDTVALASTVRFLGFTGETLQARADKQAEAAGAMAATVEPLISARLAARKAKDFKESDRIRDELAKMGIALKDTKNKETGEIETTWEVVR